MTGPVLHGEETGNGTEEVIVSGPLNRGIVRFQTSEPQDRGEGLSKYHRKDYQKKNKLFCFFFFLD